MGLDHPVSRQKPLRLVKRWLRSLIGRDVFQRPVSPDSGATH